MFRLFVTVLATLVSFSFTGTAQAFTISTPPLGNPPLNNNQHPADVGFEDILRNGQVQEVFVPGVRGGNNGTSGEREVEILDDLNVTFSNPTSPGVISAGSQSPIAGGEGQRTWVSGAANPFSLTYNPNATGAKLVFTSGNVTLTTNIFSAPVTEIFLRTRAGAQNNVGTFTTSVTNLVLNNTAIANSLSSSCTQAVGSNATCADVDYLRIQGLNGGFTLTGNSSFSWTSTSIPTNSRMMFQVKAMTTGSRANNAAPAPGMIGGIVLMGLGSLWKKRKGKV
jgi:hypothetical protein